MKKILTLLGIFVSTSLFSQNFNKGYHIMLQSVDTSYFDENGVRWSEFSLTPKKYFKVVDLIDSDTICDCMVIKDSKIFIDFMKSKGLYNTKGDKKFAKKIIAYVECKMEGHDIFLWITDSEGFGYLISETLN